MGRGKHGASLLPEHRSRPPLSFFKLSQTLTSQILVGGFYYRDIIHCYLKVQFFIIFVYVVIFIFIIYFKKFKK
jgi:hypothetical protein